jgi:small subunit ribosomal protein S20
MNRQSRSSLRTGIKKLRGLLAEKKADEAKTLFLGSATSGEGKKRKARGLVSLIDTSARKGTIHRNTAKRYKSRLQRQINSLGK